MARNSRRSNGMKKIEPAVNTVFFTSNPSFGGVSTSYIDLSQVASLVNRRFYRQGLNWAVAGMKIFGTVDCTIKVSKLPTTWVMSNAWEKSFRTWQQMIKNATDESGAESIKGKFLDFKIYADAGHHQLSFDANLLPKDDDGNFYAVGQWQPSELQIPSTVGVTNTRELIAVGPNLPGASPITGFDAVSVVQGYADSRALPSTADPNVPADASENWMVKLFDNVSDQDQDVIADLEVTGNNPPYPFEGDEAGTVVTMYPGGETNAPTLQVHDTETITSTTIGGMTRIQGGQFPCGLIKIEVAGLSQNDLTFGIQLELVPGNHRGYLCEPMTEM